MAVLIATMFLVLSGVWAGSAFAGPDQQPDTTLDDHPSGKDRNEEPGGSGTQGKSTSDPDGTANRGADKPGGDGGFDADKDGNNGCGNDDDFEDDNNGNCRGRVRTQGTTETTTSETTTSETTTSETTTSETTTSETTTTEETTTPSTTTTTTPVTTEAVVQGVTLERQPTDDTKVLGVAFVRGETGALAATGTPSIALMTIGCALIALGALLVVGGRRRETSLA